MAKRKTSATNREPAKKPRKKSPWPRGWRMDPANDPIASFADNHPAKRLLFAHAHCRNECAGCEIAYVGRESEAFDQEFHSPPDTQTWQFSGFIYIYVCISLILTEWLTHPPTISAGEKNTLTKLPRIRVLLADCRAAAQRDGNERVLQRLPLVEAFFNAWEASILARLKHDHIPFHVA